MKFALKSKIIAEGSINLASLQHEAYYGLMIRVLILAANYFLLYVILINSSQKQLPRKLKTRLVTIGCAGYILAVVFILIEAMKHVSLVLRLLLFLNL